MDIINWKEFLLPYEQTVNELVVKLQGIQNNYIITGNHSPIEEVNGRVKKIGSILDKAKRKNINYNNIESEILDIAGLRVICKFTEDIFIVVEQIRNRVGNDLVIIKENDYVTDEKQSGYKSYHILIEYKLMTLSGIKYVPAEIQIRTLAMNFWATIEHSLNYKYNHNIPQQVKERLISASKASSALDLEMSDIREEILETIQISKMRNRLIDEILGRIETLYQKDKIENANELNKQFFELYENATVSELAEFNHKITIISKLYGEEQ